MAQPPGNGAIAFSSRHTIFTVNADGSGLTRVGSGVHPVWSPDGELLAFLRPPNPNRRWRTFAVYVMDPDGRNLHQVTPSGLRARDARWSPDAQQISFQARPDGRGLWIIDADGSDMHRLMGARSGQAAWSPAGSSIAFAHSQGVRRYGIYLAHSDGSDAVNLGLGDRSEGMPSWSPEGQRLAFLRSGGVWTMRADGTDEVKCYSGEGSVKDASWSPDGSVIGFSVFRHGERDLFVIDAVECFEPVNLTGERDDVLGWTWSPDGTKIVILQHRGPKRAWGNLDMWVIDSDGGGADRIVKLRPQLPPSWQPLPP